MEKPRTKYHPNFILLFWSPRAVFIIRSLNASTADDLYNVLFETIFHSLTNKKKFMLERVFFQYNKLYISAPREKWLRIHITYVGSLSGIFYPDRDDF